MKELQYITISVLFDALIIPDLASGDSWSIHWTLCSFEIAQLVCEYSL